MSDRKKHGGPGSMFLPPSIRIAMGCGTSPALDRALLYAGTAAGIFLIVVFVYSLLVLA